MADSSDSQASNVTETEEAQERQELDELKRDLEGWREAFIPLGGLLTWEKPYYPAVIFGVTTLFFALIWILDPTVLTTFAVLALVITVIDFVLPFVSPYIFTSIQWTAREEQQFEETCKRILHFRTHVSQFFQAMAILKEERPKIYFLLIISVLAFLAWFGNTMNNLYLSYFIVLTILMIPGLRQTGMMQRYLLKYWLIFKRLVFGRMEVIKRKMN